MSELAKISNGSGIVSAGGIDFIEVVPERLLLAVYNYCCSPLATIFVQAHSFIAGRISTFFICISTALRPIAWTKVASTVVKSIVIFVVYESFISASDDESVHVDVFAVKFGDCVGSTSPCGVPFDIHKPVPFRPDSVIAEINKGMKSFSQRDVTALSAFDDHNFLAYWGSVNFTGNTLLGISHFHAAALWAGIALGIVWLWDRMILRLGNSFQRAHVPPRMECAGRAALCLL